MLNDSEPPTIRIKSRYTRKKNWCYQFDVFPRREFVLCHTQTNVNHSNSIEFGPPNAIRLEALSWRKINVLKFKINNKMVSLLQSISHRGVHLIGFLGAVIHIAIWISWCNWLRLRLDSTLYKAQWNEPNLEVAINQSIELSTQVILWILIFVSLLLLMFAVCLRCFYSHFIMVIIFVWIAAPPFSPCVVCFRLHTICF